MTTRREDNPPGRMLFTDFDASRKGRPALSAAADGFVGNSLPTLDDLASSLDFDFFEDDVLAGKDAGDGHAAMTAAKAPERPSVRPRPSGHSPSDSGPGSAFSGNQSSASIAKPSSRPAPLRIAADDGGGEGVPEWFDIFPPSRSAPALRPPPRRPEVDADEQADDAPFSMDADSDAGRNAGETGEDAGTDDMDDILSSLPATEEDAAASAPAGHWHGARLGIRPPRAIPYGGIRRLEEWYRPPEIDPNDGRPVREEDWYEPPEKATRRREREAFERERKIRMDAAARAENAPPPVATPPGFTPPPMTAAASPPDDIMGDDILGGDIMAADTGPIGPTRSLDSDSTSAVDFFSGLDIDSLWEEKTHGRRDSVVTGVVKTLPPGATFPRGSHSTSAMDFFSDLDIDSLWEEKIRDRNESDWGADTRILNSTETTVLKHEEAGAERDWRARADNHSAIIIDTDKALRDEAMPHAPEPAGKPLSPSPQEPAPEMDSALESVSGPPAESMPDTEEEAPPASPEASVADAARERHANPETLDDLDVDALLNNLNIDGEVVSDVVAPVIGDDAILHPVRGGRPAAAAGETPDETDSAERMPEDGADGEADESASGTALSPDDVFSNMDDMDFSDDGLDDDVKAMLDADAEEAASTTEAEAGSAAAASPIEEPPPAGRAAKILYYAKRRIRRLLPGGMKDGFLAMIGWRENWWFYCDLLAAFLTSASLAVILSYLIWYRK